MLRDRLIEAYLNSSDLVGIQIEVVVARLKHPLLKVKSEGVLKCTGAKGEGSRCRRSDRTGDAQLRLGQRCELRWREENRLFAHRRSVDFQTYAQVQLIRSMHQKRFREVQRSLVDASPRAQLDDLFAR